ncbi:MAG: sigma-70 family RNA polymerase sigma factor [Tepidisphaeraceae bacterium]
MTEPTDLDLLRAYAADGDELAFRQLVERHAGWIFAASRRRLKDDHLADDVTQAVFLVLAEKASRLMGSKRRSLSAWLFQVMHFACVKTRRARSRQERREQHANSVRETERSSRIQPNEALLTLLDDTIAQLPVGDREAIVRRFYQREHLAIIGAALNISAEAARKRIARTLTKIRMLLVRDGVDVIPDTLLGTTDEEPRPATRAAQATIDSKRINSIAKGTVAMVQQAHASEFTMISAEFYVKDVEANLAYFEKLGFRRRWAETPDAAGRLPRASLAGGAARIWLRRASDTEGTRPLPGVGLFFWIDGGPESLMTHRNMIAEQGIAVSPFADDHTLRNFTVTTPDGYTIGFYTAYR